MRDIDDICLNVPEELTEAFEKAAAFLKVKGVRLKLVPFIYNSPTFGAIGIANTKIDGVPVEEYCLGSYMENENTIYLAQLLPTHEDIIVFPNTWLIETMLHEIRHVWQKKYHSDIYYENDNAIAAEEHFDDISEIDADAFAIAYEFFILGNKELSPSLQYMYMCDNGKRGKRLDEIVSECGLTLKA